MNRVLLDTNIYGLIALSDESDKITENIAKGEIIVVGFDLIRKELRSTPKNLKIGDKKLRIELLGFYDTLVRGHDYKTTKIISELAEEYFETIFNLGVRVPKHKILHDLLIVACASVNEVDVVVSEDKRTMLSNEFLTGYRIVNNIRKLRMPQFIGYEKFTRSFSL